MNLTFEQFEKGYANLWARCAPLSGSAQKAIDIAKQLASPAARAHYEAAAKQSSVPAGLIAALNYREGGGLFTRYLGNGDPLSRASTHVPSGRGPFATWEAGAADALRGYERPSAARWSIEFALYFAENYNGRGYSAHNENSPYVWALTTLEQHGEFVADHIYDPSDWDQRPGVAALFLAYATVAPDWIIPSLNKMEQTMTTAATATPSVDPFPAIIEALNMAKMILPLATPILGPAPEAVAAIIIPLIEDGINMAEQARTTGVAAPDFATFLHNAGAAVQQIAATLKPKTA